MDDAISRQAAIDTLERTKRIASYELHGGEVLRTFNVVLNSLINIMSLLPPVNNSEIPNSSDTISRAKAIEAIDEIESEIADGLGFEYEKWRKHFCDLPPAQPEIIRCKDCKFWTHIKRTNRYWCKTDDGLYDLNPSPNDFCSRAERREVTT